MMENKISYEDERKMTNAIESAATLASNDASRDRSATLAGQLKEAGVDSRFAKVASAAFNKRLTVLTFKKTADEHKADPFELADADKVLELMTGESLEKAASLVTPFEITYSDNTLSMQKAASEEPAIPFRLPYEDTIRYEALVRHIESVMEKNAAALQDIVYALDDTERKADALSTDLANYFMKSASASFEFDTLVNAYGDRFKDAIGAKLPENTEYVKTASNAILPDEPLYKRASEMVEAHEAADALKQSLEYYGAGLGQFCKAAAELGDMIQKMEMSLIKKAVSGGGIALETINDFGALTTPAVPHGIAAADALVNGISNTAGNALSNAYALYQSGNAAHMAPNEVLDAEFLTKDRYRDRLLGWSDMTADPQFAMYPAEQVFMATQKAMDMDTTLERPDKREVLRAYVAQLLAQNNRLSTADIAAFAQTLRGLTSGDEHGAQQLALKSVKGMDEVRAPEMPVLKAVIEGRREIPTGTDAIAEVEKSIKDFAAEGKADKKEKADRESKARDAADKARLEAERSERDKEKVRIAAQNARNKFLNDVLNIKIKSIDPATGKIEYDAGGTTLDEAAVQNILANAESIGRVPALA